MLRIINGFKTFLVDKFRTSCKCSKCDGGSCEKFMVRENPKPFRANLRLVHGLLSCKNCGNVNALHQNRDTNGAQHIYNIAYNSIHNLDRPDYLCRNTSGVLSCFAYIHQNQNLHVLKRTNLVKLKPAF